MVGPPDMTAGIRGLFVPLILILGVSDVVEAQAQYVREISVIPVVQGSGSLVDPFTGGINAPLHQFADIDSDGDPDLFVFDSDFYPILSFYRNEGDSASPDFRYSVPNPLRDIPISFWFLFVDFDSDGLPDLAADDGGTGISIWRNDGTAGAPHFSFLETLSDTLGTPLFAGFSSLPGFVDIDGDGLIDFFSSNSADGSFNYYGNVGTPGSPRFVLSTTTFGGITIIGDRCTTAAAGAVTVAGGSFGQTPSSPRHGSASMAFADLEADGTFDLFSGDIFWTGMFRIRNDGSAAAPVMECAGNSYPPGGGLSTVGWNQPTFADIDADGDLDLFVGVLNSRDRHAFWWYENAGSEFLPIFELRTTDYISTLDIGQNAHPAAADVDGDADLDVVIGAIDGRLWLLRNDGSAGVPVFTVADSAWGGISGNSAYAPAFADLDADEDLDLILGRFDGRMIVYLASDGSFVAADTLLQQQFASPAVADIDGDGDVDLIAGHSDGRLNLYRNIGDSTAFIFVLDSANYLGVDVGAFSRPAFSANRVTGLHDLYVTPADASGSEGSTIWYFRNAGTAVEPDFEFVTDQYGPPMPYEPALAFADIDADGDDDLFVGTSKGGLHFYRRTPAVSVDDDTGRRDSLDRLEWRPTGPAPPVPVDFRVRSYPNPFNGQVTISVELPRAGEVRIDIFTVGGEHLRTLAERELPAGQASFIWSPEGAPSGLYVCRVTAGGAAFHAKMLYIR